METVSWRSIKLTYVKTEWLSIKYVNIFQPGTHSDKQSIITP